MEDVFELLKVQENLQIIHKRKEEVFLKLEMIEQSLLTLEKMGISKDEDLKKIKHNKEEWNNLLKMAVTVEKDIASPVKAESDKSKENLAKFEEHLKEYYIKMKKEDFYQYKTGAEASR